ncbi:MAG: hypothetical protein ACFB4J_12805, partial [Elainellaceae cyanobacterium]
VWERVRERVRRLGSEGGWAGGWAGELGRLTGLVWALVLARRERLGCLGRGESKARRGGRGRGRFCRLVRLGCEVESRGLGDRGCPSRCKGLPTLQNSGFYTVRLLNSRY